MSDQSTLVARIQELERKVRRDRVLTLLAITGVLGTWVLGAGPGIPRAQDDTLRARVLVIEDAEGRDRIVLGAPMPDPRQVTGMKILNPEGAEQFGLSLKHDGGMSMGFDVQPGVGDPRNRERLNLGVNASGQGWVRYLDNRTRARMYLYLDSSDTPWLSFFDWSEEGEIHVRKIGFSGEETEVLER